MIFHSKGECIEIKQIEIYRIGPNKPLNYQGK